MAQGPSVTVLWQSQTIWVWPCFKHCAMRLLLLVWAAEAKVQQAGGGFLVSSACSLCLAPAPVSQLGSSPWWVPVVQLGPGAGLMLL